ncbi:hypothetical protein EVJ30_04390 [Exiguobacterium sp. SH5S13]|uniref:hypothetical protein n=1 Tax=Exiguobacterium sp. SH5S13 TaxID=2510959 RepID=UPI00103A8549|nr:hypothetical protein [Exiguobacterium sp. SH5S13]TCI56132.1 hypothetical protein EVJ30_04390 [Exiguobacterium sp. SH5S13]
MGKLNFLLAEDYIKPRIYFQAKQTSSFKASYSYADTNQFEGLEHLTQLLRSSKGFILNAFQIDYYQALPKLIARTLQENRSHKKLYILGPELSLSILKRSSKTVYEKHFQEFGYINIEQDQQIVISQCLSLLKEGHILYILPEASICWQPEPLQQFENSFTPLCSTLLSQEAHVPILSSATTEESDKVKLYEPNMPQQFIGDFESRIAQQSEAIYTLLESPLSDY